MDDLDRRILSTLQENADVSVADIGEKVGLSTTPCWRRIQLLQDKGIIRKRVALLDPIQLNVGVTVFVAVRTTQHNTVWFNKFVRVVNNIPEVVEFYRMSGEVDYMLKIVVPDIAAYDEVYKRLIAKIDLSDVSSSFAMEQIKYSTALPLEYSRGKT